MANVTRLTTPVHGIDSLVGHHRPVAFPLQTAAVRGDDTRSDGVEVAVDDTPSGRVVTVRVEGELDLDTATTVVNLARAIVDGGAIRLDLDLRSLSGFDAEATWALVACRDVCAPLPEGLHYRTGSGPGREALLAAYART